MRMGDIYIQHIFTYICVYTYMYVYMCIYWIYICTTANHHHTWQIVTIPQAPFGHPFQAQRVCQLRHRFGWGMKRAKPLEKSGKVNSGRVKHGTSNKTTWKIGRIRTCKELIKNMCVALPSVDLKTSGNLESELKDPPKFQICQLVLMETPHGWNLKMGGRSGRREAGFGNHFQGNHPVALLWRVMPWHIMTYHLRSSKIH